ncbi:MAG: serine/threonine protein kinase [Candidatus Riflebacteria bacterium]|nr:serine/threonine protein kinase [Candidatus Riflebacteria bacterium]
MGNPFPPRCRSRFVPREQLAAGGFGTVFLATQLSLDRLAAVKLLHAHLIESREMLVRLRREAQLTATLSHPGIVRVIDFDMDDEVPWIAYEYLKGRTVADVIRDGAMPWPLALEAVRQIASALEETHRHGIIHRDLKPANILLVEPATYKIIDLGVARCLDTTTLVTVAGQALGTPTHMAPELFTGRAASPRSDLYSLGVILFELLTGKRPYPARTIADLIAKHSTAPVPRPSATIDAIPARVDELVSRTLGKMPEDRFESASELRAAVVSILGDLSPATRSATQAARPQEYKAPGPKPVVVAARRSAECEHRVGSRAVQPRAVVFALAAVALVFALGVMAGRWTPPAAGPVSDASAGGSSPGAAAPSTSELWIQAHTAVSAGATRLATSESESVRMWTHLHELRPSEAGAIARRLHRDLIPDTMRLQQVIQKLAQAYPDLESVPIGETETHVRAHYLHACLKVAARDALAVASSCRQRGEEQRDVMVGAALVGLRGVQADPAELRRLAACLELTTWGLRRSARRTEPVVCPARILDVVFGLARRILWTPWPSSVQTALHQGQVSDFLQGVQALPGPSGKVLGEAAVALWGFCRGPGPARDAASAARILRILDRLAAELEARGRCDATLSELKAEVSRHITKEWEPARPPAAPASGGGSSAPPRRS